MSIPFDEEPWEAQVNSMLAGLPEIEPPAGFIDSALDHRPLHAGRILVGLLSISLAAVLASIATGAVGRTQITPRLDDLALRHNSAVQAGVLGGSQVDVDYPVEMPVDMPDGFQRTRNLAAEDIRQAVYGRGDESVSVFVQEGTVQWDGLPSDGLTRIDGLTAWVDDARLLTVVEASNSVVTIVGLPADEVAEVLDGVPRTGPTVGQRAQDTVNAITRQLGFPDLG
jgi:hypothetical protein